jgi:hypothetical protein
MTGCMRTTSSESLQSLTGLMPFEFEIEQRVATQYLTILSDLDLQNRLDFNHTLENHKKRQTHKFSLEVAEQFFALADLDSNEIPTKPRKSEEIHPANWKQNAEFRLPPQNLLTDQELEGASVYYTDASKIPDGPCGVASISKNDTMWELIYSASYNSTVSVYRGELLAIHATFEYVSNIECRNQTIVVRTDSLSG